MNAAAEFAEKIETAEWLTGNARNDALRDAAILAVGLFGRDQAEQRLRSAAAVDGMIPSAAEQAIQIGIELGLANGPEMNGDAFDDPAPGRDPEINRALDGAFDALRLSDNTNGKLLAVRNGAKELHPFGDDATEAMDLLSEVAINSHDLDPAAVQDALAQGVEIARQQRAMRLNGSAAGSQPQEHREAPGTPPNEGLPIEPFDTFDANYWQDVETKPRRWLVRDRIPAGEPGIVSGDGGTGKTKLMLQLAVADAAELPDWIGGLIEMHGAAIVFSAEEKLEEMHRRVADILVHRGLAFSSLKNRLRFICDPDDVTLAKADRNGNVTPTLSLLRLEKTVALIRPVLVVIENAADVFAGNENDRAQVSRFMRKHLGSLTLPSDAAVALIQHPSLTGLGNGTGTSGSTGWNNAGRWRLNFTKDGDDARQLEVIKSNYGPTGEKVRVRWERGVFVPERSASPAQRAAAEAPIDDAFMRCLRAAAAQGRAVSPAVSNIWAPSVFEGMPEAAGFMSKALAGAMERALSAGRIKIETSGPPSRQRQRITLPTPLPTNF